MATTFEIIAETRRDVGKGASRRLRRSNDKVPAIIYGGGEDPLALSIDHNHLRHALQNEAFYSHILTVIIDGKKQQAVLKDLQRHPSKPRLLHMDLLRITGKEKINMQVPLHFLGGDKAPGVVKDGGIVSHLQTSLEVRCLPADLPEYIEVDISSLELDEAIHLSDLTLPKGVESVALMHGHGPEHNVPVASIHIPRAALIEEEAETAAPVAPAAPEAIRQVGDKEPGSEGSEG
jgi:large subunit ribosomal protein L25